jgi:hypothetical protein
MMEPWRQIVVMVCAPITVGCIVGGRLDPDSTFGLMVGVFGLMVWLTGLRKRG